MEIRLQQRSPLSLSEVFAEVDAAKTAGADERPLLAAIAGEHLDMELTDADSLSASGKRLAEIARGLGADCVLGASPLGERLAGAAIAIAGDGLSAYNKSRRPSQVLVVDGLLVTGSQIAAACHKVRTEAGAKTAAAVLVSVTSDLNQLRELADPIVVLEA